jgi:hypothetical protein
VKTSVNQTDKCVDDTFHDAPPPPEEIPMNYDATVRNLGHHGGTLPKAQMSTINAPRSPNTNQHTVLSAKNTTPENDKGTHNVAGETRVPTLGKEHVSEPWHSSTIVKKMPPHPNIPTNDGTHRVNVKWTPPDDINAYEQDKSKINMAIHSLVTEMLPEDAGVLYRWESEDLVNFKTAKTMTPTEVWDFITPKISLLPTSGQMIFGLRVGFKDNPVKWRKSEQMKTILKARKLEISISNSQSTSRKMVTAGYILLKAPNTTNATRYTQYVRSLLPATTPYFDIYRRKKTPMDQLIPHLTIQCGEKHVTPVCQALLPVLTGRGKALFLPRYALSTAMTHDQVRKHFEFHQKWSRSLKSITLSPQINHLDQKRVEYNEDGTTTVRSTREWATLLTEDDGITPALFDVVNGTTDQKTYLLSPNHYIDQAQQHWRTYKSRLYPPSHREARFRDNLPGLPDVIHIQTEIQSNVSFLEQMANANVWTQRHDSRRSDYIANARDTSVNHQANTAQQNHLQAA